MDCKTARLFLHFARPRADEMDPAEIEDLDAHLVCCPDCAAVVRTERRIDHHLGRAMRQVEVPAQLRGQLLARLAADRADWYRRWVGHGARVLAVAAALLLLVWGVMRWREDQRPSVDPELVFEYYPNQRLGSAEEVEEYFARRGHRIDAPPKADYAFLTHYGLNELPGHQSSTVPRLEFVKGRDRAVVYIVSNKRFKLREPLFDPESRPGYPHKLHEERAESGRFTYLIFYHGEGLRLVLPAKNLAGNLP